jgi:hypothetical protein
MDEEAKKQRYFQLRDQGRSAQEARSIVDREFGGRGAVQELARGAGLGLTEAGTSLAKGVGWLGAKALPGEALDRPFEALESGAERVEERAKEFFDPRGTAGTVGRVTGRLGGEVLSTLGTLGASRAAAARYAPQALETARRLTQGSRARTAIGTLLAESPVTAVQVAAEASRGGDIGTALALEAAGSLLGGAIGARPRAAEDVAEEAIERAAPAVAEEVAREPVAIRRALPLTEEITPEDYINVERFTSDPEAQRRLVEAARQTVEETDVPLRFGPDAPEGMQGRLQKPETFREVRQNARRILASELGVDPTDIAGRTELGQRLGGAELLAVRTALKGVLNDESRILRDLATGAVEGQERRVLEVQLNNLQDTRNALMNSFMKQRTMAGRDLNALRMAALDQLDDVSILARVTNLAKRPLTEAEISRVIKAVNAGDMEEVYKISNEVKKSTLREKFATFFKAGLLLQPKTHLANFFGNTFLGALETFKDIPATVMDRLISSALDTKRTKDFDPRALFTASARGARRGLTEAKRAIQGDPSSLRDITRWDLGREVNYDNALSNFYTKGVFRTLDAEDRFFRGIAYQRSLEEQARLLGRSQGFRGTALDEQAARLTQAPTDEMVARAIADSEYAVFQDMSPIAKAALKLREGTGVVGDYLFPFVKTPANIADRIVDYSPVGMINFLNATRRLIKDKADAELQKRAVEAFGRSSIGTAAIIGGYLLAKNGGMTGFYPTSQRERNEWRATGKQEGSILLGDKYFNLTRISPLGNLMAIGAQMYNIASDTEKDADEKFALMAFTPLSAITDLPMTSGLRDVVDALTQAGTGQSLEPVQRLAGRTLQSAVPGSSALRGIAYGLDPYVRETRAPGLEGVGRQIVAQVPFLSQTLTPRVEPLGGLMEREAGLIGATSDPFTRTRRIAAGDPVREEIDRLNASVSSPERREGESDEEYLERSQVTGTTVKNALSALLASPQYQLLRQVDPTRLRAAAAGLDINLENVSDEQIADRIQRYVLERAASSVSSAVSRNIYPNVTGGAAGTLLRQLEVR